MGDDDDPNPLGIFQLRYRRGPASLEHGPRSRLQAPPRPLRLHRQGAVDSAAFTFRGETRVDVALKDVRAAAVGRDGGLTVTHAGGEFTLELEHSAAAVKWARKLLHPPTLADKLGLKPEQRVVVLGVEDAGFLAEAAGSLRIWT